ncbi:RadC family protein [Kosmotoga pacifica]|uniref:RadC family protein n=1 Tax=Kosmotoga pacifica TaxID=1330330 RepID=UPI000B1BEEF1|nr:DNA repair protein RadC [Kosmotoga pacifica]
MKAHGNMPREKLAEFGPEALSSSELIAILLRTGFNEMDVIKLSQNLLNRYGSLTRLLATDLSELSSIRGIGFAKAVTLKAALEIGNRIFKEIASVEKRALRDPESVYYLCHDMTLLEEESVRVISLDSKLNLSGYETVSVGTIDSSLLHPREVFKSAIRKAAAAIIVVHNHPSGDPTPSSEDIKITEKLTDAGKIVGIKLLDHVIIGKGKYYSFSASKIFSISEVQHDFAREIPGAYKEKC